MLKAILFEQFRTGCLQVNIIALAGAEGFRHLFGRAAIEHRDLRPIHLIHVRSVTQHGERLTAVIGKQGAAFEILPPEGLVPVAAGQEEAIAAVDESEVDRQR